VSSYNGKQSEYFEALRLEFCNRIRILGASKGDMRMNPVSVVTALLFPAAGGDDDAADIVISGNNGSAACTVGETQLSGIRARAEKLLTKAINKGYGNFPINRSSLIQKTLNKFINKDAVCAALINEPQISEANHNQLREKYKGSSLNPGKARENGLVALRVPLKTACPDDFDWGNSQFYNQVDSCQDVLDVIDAKGLATVMYAVNMPNKDAAGELSDISIASYYTRYTNGGPVVCGKGDDYVDAYHSITVSKAVPSIDYIMRGYEYTDWSAWALLRSCKGADGKLYEASDLMFNFGARVFIPVKALIDGAVSNRTLIITSVAAASTNPLAGLVPDSIAFHRLIGGEFAKKVMLTALDNGWELEKN
jgi:hypothetical protein